jgi:glycosyltransferase involved in cell wall biosynthesis
MIYQCSSINLDKDGGGIETYLTSLLQYRIPNVSDRILTSLKDLDQSKFKLLHLHGSDLLEELRGKCPSIYTLHNHSAYCPSGTKYLKTSTTCCDRNMSTLTCTWGHIVDGCGSRRPQKILYNLQRSHLEFKILKKLKIPVIANSDYVRNQLIKNGLSPKQTITLLCAVAVSDMSATPLTLETHQQQRLLFVGRIVPEKGLNFLLEALTQTDRRIQLDIAGEGWDRPRIQRMIENLELGDRITWHGWCDREKLEVLYQQCFALVFPSIWPEPAGLITLESSARYRPVIASSVGGIPEYVRHGETGILVAANKAKELSAAINDLSSSYQKSRSMGERGYAWVREVFTLDRHVERLRKLYEKTISDFHDSI